MKNAETSNPSPWLLLLWVIFEPQYLKKYAAKLTRIQKVTQFLKVYVFAIIPAALLMITIALPIFVAIVVLFDLPTTFPPDQPFLEPVYIEQFTQQWQSLSGFQEKFNFYFHAIFQKYTSINIISQDFFNGLLAGISLGLVPDITSGLACLLGVGLGIGFTTGLIFTLAGYLVIGLVLGLAYSLAGGLAGGLAMGLSVGVAYAAVYGFAFGLSFAVAESIAFGFIFALVSAFVEGFTYHITYGLVFIPIFFLFYFRIIFYPFYLISTRMSYIHLKYNPYIYDGLIWLPIWKVDHTLLKQAHQQPEDSIELIRFLHEYRPLQMRMATYLNHAATVAHWKQKYPHINMLNLEAETQC